MNNQVSIRVEDGWKCLVCGNEPKWDSFCGMIGLQWTILHGECYCEECGMPYYFYDENKMLLTAPRPVLSETGITLFKKDWMKNKTPLGKMGKDFFKRIKQEEKKK